MTRGVALAVLFAVLVSPWAMPAVAAGWPVISGPYFGQKPPGMRAELFAPGIVSSEHHDDGPPAFSPDGRECYWRVVGQRDSVSTVGVVFWSRELKGRWTEPRLAPFSIPDDAVGVSFRPDGRRLYFWARRLHPGDPPETRLSPWFVDRTSSGWSEPHPLLLPIGKRHLASLCAARDGSLLCVLEDPVTDSAWTAVSRIPAAGDSFAAPEPMGVVPTGDEKFVSAPTFSPDGNTFLYTARSEKGLFLKVSFRRPDGAWTAPQPLGDDINAPPHTKFAGYSPDGRYLFVVSNRRSPKANPPQFWKSDVFRGPQREPLCDVYWVDAKAVEALRPPNR
jgi:hypothetical protein